MASRWLARKRLIRKKGRISSQDIPAGTKVEAYTTLKYYISKGQEELTIPEYDETVTAYAYQKSLEDMGLTVNVQERIQCGYR